MRQTLVTQQAFASCRCCTARSEAANEWIMLQVAYTMAF